MNELIELWIKVTKGRELEELPKEFIELYDYTVKLQRRNDKALEYIEKVGNLTEPHILNENNLTDILGGESNE